MEREKEREREGERERERESEKPESDHHKVIDLIPSRPKSIWGAS
jgi:hypothetical protein